MRSEEKLRKFFLVLFVVFVALGSGFSSINAKVSHVPADGNSAVSTCVKRLDAAVEKAYANAGLNKEDVVALFKEVGQAGPSQKYVGKWQSYQKAKNALRSLRQPAIEELTKLGPGVIGILLRVESQSLKFAGLHDVFLEAVVRMGSSAVPVLIDELSGTEVMPRLHATTALGRIGDSVAVDHLIRSLADSDERIIRAAVWSLGLLKDKRATEPLLDLWNKQEIIARSRLAWALGRIGDKRAVEPIMAALEECVSKAEKTGNWDNNSWDMHTYAGALGQIGDSRAVPLLKKMLLAEPQKTKAPAPQYQVAEAAAQALRSFGVDVEGDKEKGEYKVIADTPSANTKQVLKESARQERAVEDLGRQQQSIVVFPKDGTTINLHWVPGKPDDVSAVQKIKLLLIRRYYTYEVDTKDLISGQMANKSSGWAVYPSLEIENQQPFPVELVVRTEQPATPHSNYHALVKEERQGRRLQWTASEQRVPSHFGYFEVETEEKVPNVNIRRECVPIGNGRARIKTIVRAQVPLLIRIWGLKQRISVESESIEPKDYRLSDNGVLFFNYGKDPEELGSELEYRFTISGLDEGELFYPMTNALHRVHMYSRDCPDNPMRQIRGSEWGFDFTLKSKQCFKISRLGRWVNELYQLKALTTKPSRLVTGSRLRANDVVATQVRDYEAARNIPQPIELWKVKEYGCGGNPRTQQKLYTDVKRQYPIELTWPLIQEAGKYVIQIKGVRGSHPAKSFESITNHLCLEKAYIVPGRYQWSVSVYDKQGHFMGDIETIDPVEIFAIEDTESFVTNGKKVLLDLNHSAGHVRGWGYYNHAQYMTKELLENAGFQVQVNEHDLLTADRLKSVDLLICHYYWTGWPDFRAYLRSELSAVLQFVEGGGSLLVIGCDRKDGGGKMSKAANELIKEFGLMFELDDISRQHGLAKPAPEQNVISFDKPVQVQLPVSVRGEDAITLLQYDGIPIVKAKQMGRGKAIVAGVGMSFLDCYLGDFEHREPLHLLMFYDFTEYLTGIEWKKSCAHEFVEMVISHCQLYTK